MLNQEVLLTQPTINLIQPTINTILPIQRVAISVASILPIQQDKLSIQQSVVTTEQPVKVAEQSVVTTEQPVMAAEQLVMTTAQPIIVVEPIILPLKQPSMVASSSTITEQKLNNFIKEMDYLPKQRTKEWLQHRKDIFYIGGSEMNSFLTKERARGQDNREDLLNKKAFGNNFTGNSDTFWGNLFEDILKKFIENRHNVKIYNDFGSIPNKKTGLIEYSPDGIGIYNYEIGDSMIIPLIYLYEFKCPSRRKIISGKVPEKYMPQVQTGLGTITICDKCLFVEGKFVRRDFIEDYTDSSNIVSFHKQLLTDANKFDTTYMDKYSYAVEILNTNGLRILNIGKLNYNDFNIVFEDIMRYTKVSYNDDRQDDIESSDLVAYMPWELTYLNEVTVEKDNNFINESLINDIENAKKICETKRKKLI
jgi:hypothetical protein